jgi:SlyX protein
MSDSGSRLQAIEHRLEQLEIKASYSDDLLDTLNTLVAQQQQHIDLLLREMQWMRQQAADSQSGTFRSLRDDLPPHY